MRKNVFLLLMVLLLSQAVNAQTHQLSGQVLGAGKNESLPGVSVLVKETSKGTATDMDGKFTLSVNSGQDVTLVFKYIGYSDKEVIVKAGQDKVDVQLTPVDAALNEVVVVGYGTVKKRDLTGAVTQIKGDEIVKVPSTSVTEALQGKVPGLDITRSNGYAGGSTSATVRGDRSINAQFNNILYIVDGVQAIGYDINSINPNDIQSVDVLKDASSTAIYGSRGANGVIIITTKRGSADKTLVNFNTYQGVSKVTEYAQMMTGPEFVSFRRQAYQNAGQWNGTDDDSKIFNATQIAAINAGQFTNWSDLLLHNGAQQDYQVSVSGGTEKTKIYFSGDYFHEQGLLRLDDYKRYVGRLNIDQIIKPWLKMGVSSQFGYVNNGVRQDPLNQASRIFPIGNAFDASGNLILYPGGSTLLNPLVDEQPNVWNKNHKIANVSFAPYIELTPIKNLSIRSNFVANYQNDVLGSFYAKNTISGGGNNSVSNITPTQNTFISWENIINYKKDIKDHSFAITGVTSYNSNVSTFSYAQGYNQLLPSQLFYNLAGATQNLTIGSNYQKYNLISYTGRFNYTYKGRYLFQVTGREDESSKLGEGHKGAFFPSASFGWRIIDEDFMKKQSVFTDLKLRLSYGKSGNDAVGPYSTQSSLTLIPYSYDDANAAAAYGISGQIGNNTLKWETTATKDIGLDFGLLKNRLTGSIDYYDAHTSDLLFLYQMPFSTGVTSLYRNIGETRNRGVEIALNSVNIDTKGFKWKSTIAFAKNKEQIVSLPNGNVIAPDYRNSLIVGQPIKVFYDYKKIGIWQTSEAAQAAKFGAQPGDVKIQDISGPNGVPDGVISAQYDRQVIGTAAPKWTGSLSNSFSYKGFDMDVLLYARIGQWISSDYYGKFDERAINNQPAVNYWTPTNPTNDFPRPNANANTPYITAVTLRDASFVKLRSVSLGYTFTKTLLKKIGIDNLRIYATGRNLATFSKIKDFDPEGGGGVDKPLDRLYVLGINLGL